MRKLIVLGLMMILLGASQALARVSGVCSNCHTMHNSQNGAPVTEGVNPGLTKYDCVGCHSSSESSTTYQLGDSTVPVVLYTGGSAPSQYLAGGNFYWVKEGLGNTDGKIGDPKGHNVFLNEDDDFLTKAPGGQITCGTTSCHARLSRPAEGVSDPFIPDLEGRYGCRGCHLRPKHHALDHPNGNYDNVVGESGGWYRFLSGHMGGQGRGVEGIEDNDWQATVSSSDHNEYLGVTGAYTGVGGFGMGVNAMTAYCTGCHGFFHQQSDNPEGGSPWLRHPSDAVLPSSGEYAAYTTYNPLAPVARPSLSNTGPSATVTPGEDMVMCLSCHRPHGSPYDDILRWDYSKCTVDNSSDCGCFVCHTKKGTFQ